MGGGGKTQLSSLHYVRFGVLSMVDISDCVLFLHSPLVLGVVLAFVTTTFLAGALDGVCAVFPGALLERRPRGAVFRLRFSWSDFLIGAGVSSSMLAIMSSIVRKRERFELRVVLDELLCDLFLPVSSDVSVSIGTSGSLSVNPDSMSEFSTSTLMIDLVGT